MHAASVIIGSSCFKSSELFIYLFIYLFIQREHSQHAAQVGKKTSVQLSVFFMHPKPFVFFFSSN